MNLSNIVSNGGLKEPRIFTYFAIKYSRNTGERQVSIIEFIPQRTSAVVLVDKFRGL